MRSKIILLSIILATASAKAQYFQFEVGGGLAKHYGPSKVVGSYKIGVGYEYEFNQKWTFNPQISFYGKGWKKPDETMLVFNEDGTPMMNVETGEQYTTVKSVSSTAYYLEIPLLVNYYIRTAPSQYIVLSAGPYAAIGVGGKQKTKGDSDATGARRLYYTEKTFDIEGAHCFDAGLQVGAGFQFANGLTLGAEADFGLLNVKSGGSKNVSALVSLTYKLGK